MGSRVDMSTGVGRFLGLFRPQIPTSPTHALRLALTRTLRFTPFALPFAAVELWANVAVVL